MSNLMVIKRNGATVPFTADKIRAAVLAAFAKDATGTPRKSSVSAASRDAAEKVVAAAVLAVEAKAAREGQAAVRIEDIQDQVELALMRSGEHEVARDYVLYRARRAEQRAASAAATRGEVKAPSITGPDGTRIEARPEILSALVRPVIAPAGGSDADADAIATSACRDLFEGATWADAQRAIVLASRTRIETEPRFNYITAAIALDTMKREVLGQLTDEREAFAQNIQRGIAIEMLDQRLGEFDLERLANAILPERDAKFGYIGVQTLYDRYLIVDKSGERPVRIETPQSFFMRVAMGLAINELDREARAIEFYHVLSEHRFVSSTPTLFNSGTRHPQLSSCYLTTVSDDLDGIFGAIKENAMLQKFAGGLGNDWSPVRAMGSHIKGTNGESQGTVPFLKVVNDTAVAVNQGGKRKGAVCTYLETWHLDIEEFLDLRKNTGDDRRRTHDMNTANWVPDLFMERVMSDGNWTLFSPNEVPDLHDLFGRPFKTRYEDYEAKAARGELRQHKTLRAVDLWRKMLTMLFETGHPWITFKDPCNIRSPQQHVGVIHSSNLCTEITLNTCETEIAVCNLGSVNVVAHVDERGGINLPLLRKTVATAMRMLDNVIDINYYAVAKARNANLKHRPVGLGMMGLHDVLQRCGIPFASREAVKLGSQLSEAIAFNAYWASTELAEERGRYSTFRGSLWDRGILPQDSLSLLSDARADGNHIAASWESLSLLGPEWDELRQRIAKHGMRNSNCMAVAPTATISNIIGVSACIEPIFENLFVKSNMSGEFTVINESLVDALKARGLWDDVMIADLKFYDGSLANIDRVPDDIKAIFATAFEIDPKWIVEAAAARGVWIDQAQSLNLFMREPSGRKLDELYRMAWLKGLKTTYYLRTQGAARAEKSTGRGGELNAVLASVPTPKPSSAQAFDVNADAGAFCSLDEIRNGTCEACQ